MWTYQHNFGVIHVEGWGLPFLVITENKFFNGQSWGYTYWPLGVRYQDCDTGKAEAKALNEQYKLPQIFNAVQSETLLLQLQQVFKDADIARKKQASNESEGEVTSESYDVRSERSTFSAMAGGTDGG